MFGFIKKVFREIFTTIVVNAKCASLSNQKCRSQPTVINLNPNEYIQGLRY